MFKVEDDFEDESNRMLFLMPDSDVQDTLDPTTQEIDHLIESIRLKVQSGQKETTIISDFISDLNSHKIDFE